MGAEKRHIPGRFEPSDVEHIDNIRFRVWPNLTRSAALRLIVTEHRLLTAAGIIGHEPISRQKKHCVSAEEILGLPNQRVSEPQRAEDGNFFAQERKRA